MTNVWALVIVVTLVTIFGLLCQESSATEHKHEWGNWSMFEKHEWHGRAQEAVRLGHATKVAKPWKKVKADEPTEGWIEVGHGER